MSDERSPLRSESPGVDPSVFGETTFCELELGSELHICLGNIDRRRCVCDFSVKHAQYKIEDEPYSRLQC